LQNKLPGGFTLPHLGQVSSNVCAHLLQNFASSGFSCWQFGHFMLSSKGMKQIIEGGFLEWINYKSTKLRQNREPESDE